MITKVVYCIDASAMTFARHQSYPPDNFPSIWLKIEALIKMDRLCTPYEVRREIYQIDDETKDWARKQTGLFVHSDLAYIQETTKIQHEFTDFADLRVGSASGDPFVVGLAKARNYIVVTQTKPNMPGKKTTVPTVCRHYKIPCITLLEMIQREGWKF